MDATFTLVYGFALDSETLQGAQAMIGFDPEQWKDYLDAFMVYDRFEYEEETGTRNILGFKALEVDTEKGTQPLTDGEWQNFIQKTTDFKWKWMEHVRNKTIAEKMKYAGKDETMVELLSTAQEWVIGWGKGARWQWWKVVVIDD